MSDQPAPLSLPWPAWHTDQALAFRMLSKEDLSDRSLDAMRQDHNEFIWSHSSWSRNRPHTISAREDEEAEAVSLLIVKAMADRFVSIMQKRECARIRATYSRKRNLRALRKAA